MQWLYQQQQTTSKQWRQQWKPQAITGLQWHWVLQTRPRHDKHGNIPKTTLVWNASLRQTHRTTWYPANPFATTADFRHLQHRPWCAAIRSTRGAKDTKEDAGSMKNKTRGTTTTTTTPPPSKQTQQHIDAAKKHSLVVAVAIKPPPFFFTHVWWGCHS